jgi:hypothetical protein
VTLEPKETGHEQHLWEADLNRRHFLTGAVVTAAAAELGALPSANAQFAKAAMPLIKPGTHVSLGTLKRINAGVLNVAYAEAGPADGPPVTDVTLLEFVR